MSISLDTLIAVLQETAPENVARSVLDAARNPIDDVHGLLQGIEDWASSRFGPLHIVPGERRPSSEEAPRITRRAAVSGLAGAGPRRATMADFEDWCADTASPDVIDRVRAALSDPSSELRRALLGTEQWANKTFRDRGS